MRTFLLLIFIFFNTISAQVLFSINPEISQSTWMVPVLVNTNLYESVAVKYSGKLFDTKHPSDNYTWYSYHRNGKTYVNTESYIEYSNGVLDAIFGRKYNPVGHGKMSGLFISPIAPSLDQITLYFKNISNFNFRNSIIRLDNRSKEWGGEEKVAHRWYYLRSIGYDYKDKVKINLVDAVIATGFNRGLEWYYVNPLSSLFMERKHQYHWREGSDSTSVIGQGDNDNHLIGGNLNISINNWNIYGELLIDEWQLTSKNRDSVQTVFGVMVGVNYDIEVYSFSIEYAMASPWLYLNRALYGGVEQHWQPLGLRAPQSHSLDMSFKVSFTEIRSIFLQAHLEERNNQILSTAWDAWDNKIDLFDFTKTLPVEWKIVYNDTDNKYFNKIALYHHWLGTKDTFLVLSKYWSIKFSSD